MTPTRMNLKLQICLKEKRMISQHDLYTRFSNRILLTIMYIPVRPSRRESDEDELDDK